MIEINGLKIFIHLNKNAKIKYKALKNKKIFQFYNKKMILIKKNKLKFKTNKEKMILLKWKCPKNKSYKK